MGRADEWFASIRAEMPAGLEDEIAWLTNEARVLREHLTDFATRACTTVDRFNEWTGGEPDGCPLSMAFGVTELLDELWSLRTPFVDVHADLADAYDLAM